MKITPKFSGTAKSGKVVYDNKESFDRYLMTLEGKKVNIVVAEFKKNRSLNQNRYYWGVVIKVLSDETGYEKEEMHTYLADKFLGFYTDVYGKTLKVIPTTSSLKTMEFEEYLSKIRIFASKELSIYIPDPNEAIY
jgi:hypothetical protein